MNSRCPQSSNQCVLSLRPALLLHNARTSVRDVNALCTRSLSTSAAAAAHIALLLSSATSAMTPFCHTHQTHHQPHQGLAAPAQGWAPAGHVQGLSWPPIRSAAPAIAQEALTSPTLRQGHPDTRQQTAATGPQLATARRRPSQGLSWPRPAPAAPAPAAQAGRWSCAPAGPPPSRGTSAAGPTH